MPIHCACISGVTVEVIQLLLDSDTDKRMILEKGWYGRLALHFACSCNAPAEVIQLLLDSDTEKKSIIEKDNGRNLPIHFACEAGAVEAIQVLLQASIRGRIDQLGLGQWKMDVEELVNAMTEEGSKEKVQEIYERLSKYEEMELISLLELAIWRTSCLNGGGIKRKFDSMREIEDLLATDEAFHLAEYRRERRIKSGAGAIIHGVRQFLETSFRERCPSRLARGTRPSPEATLVRTSALGPLGGAMFSAIFDFIFCVQGCS
jgi:ankyrin repeat protein